MVRTVGWKVPAVSLLADGSVLHLRYVFIMTAETYLRVRISTEPSRRSDDDPRRTTTSDDEERPTTTDPRPTADVGRSYGSTRQRSDMAR